MENAASLKRKLEEEEGGGGGVAKAGRYFEPPPADEVSVSSPQLKNVVLHVHLPAKFLAFLAQTDKERALSWAPEAVRCTGSCERKKGKPPPKPRLNFYTLRERNGVTFIVFPSSGDVIATGIRRYDQAEDALVKLAYRLWPLPDDDVLRREVRQWKWEVVNSTYSGKISADGEAVCRILSLLPPDGGPEGAKVSFRSQSFPAARVRFSVGDATGTFNVFNNGSYVLVGCKSEPHAERRTEQLCATMQTCLTTTK